MCVFVQCACLKLYRCGPVIWCVCVCVYVCHILRDKMGASATPFCIFLPNKDVLVK